MLDDFQDDNELDKGGEFLDEFRQRLNSQPIENLEERKNDINRSQHIFLGTVLGISLAGIVSWFILSPDYAKLKMPKFRLFADHKQQLKFNRQIRAEWRF